MNKKDRGSVIVLPTVLIIFALGCIAYFTKNYISAVFYLSLIIIFILINVFIKLDLIYEHVKSILYSFFSRELINARLSLTELQALSDDITREIEDMKSKLAEDTAKVVEMSAAEPQKKRRGRPKKNSN